MGGPLDLTRTPTSFAQWSIDGRRRQFGTGGLEFAELAVRRDIGVADFDQEYTFQQGRLRLATVIRVESISKETFSRRVFVWEGQFHSLFGEITNALYDDLIAILDQFSIFDSPEGLQLVPKVPEVTRLSTEYQPPFMFKYVPGIGLLEIGEMTVARAANLPPWEGISVAGGELFSLGEIDLDQGGTQASLVIVGPTTFTAVDAELGAEAEDVFNAVTELTLQWTSRDKQ